MKLKSSFFYTLREDVKDEDSTSGNLLVRAGYVKKMSSGVYAFMPLGYRVLEKIRAIVKDEMDQTDAQELLMPALISEEVYIASGRKDIIGSSMFSLKDRNDRPFVLGPTHEELFAQAAKMKIHSYKDLPFNLYQFQDKFRDEPRPRYGLIRVREFIMKDAYSFDKDLEGLDLSYQKMFNAYKNSFDRMGLDYQIVRADTGIMGGLLSEEFQALAPLGEDILVIAKEANYASNLEVAEVIHRYEDTGVRLPRTKVHTPQARTIEEVTEFLEQPIEKFIKTLIYRADERLVAVCVSGLREVNEVKLQKLLNALTIELASAEEVIQATHAAVGFAGPVGLSVDIIMDQEVSELNDFIVGANETDYHFVHVNQHDFKPTLIGDIVNIQEGDLCPADPRYTVSFTRGIEIGNTFKLGDKYSKAMDLFYMDENNQLVPVMMGSYGIGIGRCLAAIVEQNNDDNGIDWPVNIAPYQVAIIVINTKDDTQSKAANTLYEQLSSRGIDVILDNRDQRPGVKFKDMDLIGIPYRITVGKALADNNVEFKARKDEQAQLIALDSILEVLTQELTKGSR